ncbi:MAG: serine--tRNA ligase [Nitrospirota bacterium]
MLDIKFIIENPGLVKQGAAKKNVKVEIDKIEELYKQRNEKLVQAEKLRAEQNAASKGKMDNETIAKMKKIKDEIKSLEPKIYAIEVMIDHLATQVPNPPLDSVPEGKDEEDNEIVSTYGEKPKFDFEPKDHIELGRKLDIIDIERGTRTSGARFYYLKNEAALLEFALLQFVIHKLHAKGFAPVITPTLVKKEAMFATGFFPAEENEIYHVTSAPEIREDNPELFLVGTSEVPLTMLHATEILDESSLPTRYCGFSTCFRREAGSYGKDTAGIIRVHQFDKVEMFSFCHPDKSEEEFELIREIEEEIMQDLGFHYQVVNICGGDLGAPAAKKYDIEVWIPTQNKFRELTSCSNCTDFQARRAKIRYKKDGQNLYLHTLNGTAIAIARTLVAILENNQNADGSVSIPEVLHPFMGGKTKIEKK